LITETMLPKTLTMPEEEMVKEHVLEADGVSLLEVLNNPYADGTRCISNDVVEVYKVLGIEAARMLLLSEVTDIADHAGEYINNRHIEVLCDTMTSQGKLMPINRQGIGKGDAGPLAKCSFEDTTDQLVKASIFSEKDTLQGVSSNIMMGQKVRSGTGLADILLDEEELFQLLQEGESETMEYDMVDESTIDAYLEGEDIHDEDDGCAFDDFKFSFE
jgi:DNA-directed RNA polymerase II subunit RPB1